MARIRYPKSQEENSYPVHIDRREESVGLPFSMKYVEMAIGKISGSYRMCFRKDALVVLSDSDRGYHILQPWKGGVKIVNVRTHNDCRGRYGLYVYPGQVLHRDMEGAFFSPRTEGGLIWCISNSTYSFLEYGDSIFVKIVALGIMAIGSVYVRKKLCVFCHGKMGNWHDLFLDCVSHYVRPSWIQDNKIQFYFAELKYAAECKEFRKVKHLADFVTLLVKGRKARNHLFHLYREKRYKQFVSAAEFMECLKGADITLPFEQMEKLLPYSYYMEEIRILLLAELPVDRLVAWLKWKPTELEKARYQIDNVYQYCAQLLRDTVHMIEIGEIPPGNLLEAHDALVHFHARKKIESLPDAHEPITVWNDAREKLKDTPVVLEGMELTLHIPLTRAELVEIGASMDNCVGSSDSYYTGMKMGVICVVVGRDQDGKNQICAEVHCLGHGTIRLGQAVYRYNRSLDFEVLEELRSVLEESGVFYS